MSIVKNKKARILLGLFAALAVTAAAIAYWTQSGSGTGSASTGSTAGITVNQTSTISNLYPGGPAQTLSGNFDNPNDSAVQVHSVHVTVSGTDKDGCDASDFSIGGSATVDGEVPKGTGKGSWSGLTIAMVDKPTVDQNACKSANVSLSYTSD
jgi:hypothetical protein